MNFESCLIVIFLCENEVNMNSSICIADENCVDDLVLLLKSLFTQEAEFCFDAEAQRKGLLAILAAPSVGTIFVIKENEKIVGMVSLLYTVSTALGGRVALLEDMVIEKSSRKKGYGRMLLKACLRYAKENGCLRVTLLTDRDNDVAIAFYESESFRKSPMVPLRLVYGS